MKKTNHRRLTKVLSAALAAAMTLTVLPAGLSASAEESDGLTIQSNGYLYKKTSTPPSPAHEVKLVQYPIQLDYSGYTGSLEVPSTISEEVLGFSSEYKVTEIGGAEGSFPGALEGLGLTSVSLPGTVTVIGTRAFASSSVSEISFPTSVTSMAVDAFAETNLSKLTLNVTAEASLQNGTSYTTAARGTPLQLPHAVTDLNTAAPLTVTGTAELSGDVVVSQPLTVAAGASLTVRGDLSGTGVIKVENRGTLSLTAASSDYRGQIKLTGTASSLVNQTSSPLRYTNASGNASTVQPGETVTGGQTVPDDGEEGNTGANTRPQISVNQGGTVAVQNNGKVVVIIPFSGYHVDEVVINGLSMGDITRYEFQKASSENTVAVTFAEGNAAEGPDLPADDPIFIFKDVDTTAWYASAVSFMVRNKIFFGVSHDEFAPSEKTTRAMFVTLLYRLDGYDDKFHVACDSPAPLTDVKAGSWYADAAKWAVGTGVSPIGGTEFQPSDVITREEIGIWLYNFTKALGGDVEADEGILDSYSDKDKIAPEAREAMAWAATNGYLTGRSGNQLEPFSGAMRSEIAEILMRYLTANS